MKIPYLVVGVGAVAALAGCGGSTATSKTSQTPSKPAATQPAKPPVAPNLTDDQQVRNVVLEYNQAEANADGAKACSLMTPEERQKSQQGLPNQNYHYSSCAEAMTNVGQAVASVLTPAQRTAMANPTITGTQIVGNTADVAYNDGTSIHRVTLSKASGIWLISNVT